ncbi:PREDICTED: uncharacterized protein LOC104825909 [Tarenaya hassleriana]|uniref:uncharacterized protein LOC104825909 n=1 Tax=Tarenaya hassleriana TaxID=28532 RepID=UPI00053C7DCC|nr:PREDICTED: uncharacterized protein LOC104825909 [Tarenaya hassleriana]
MLLKTSRIVFFLRHLDISNSRLSFAASPSPPPLPVTVPRFVAELPPTPPHHRAVVLHRHRRITAPVICRHQVVVAVVEYDPEDVGSDHLDHHLSIGIRFDRNNEVIASVVSIFQSDFKGLWRSLIHVPPFDMQRWFGAFARDTTVEDYYREFEQLIAYLRIDDDEEELMMHFLGGLQKRIARKVFQTQEENVCMEKKTENTSILPAQRSHKMPSPNHGLMDINRDKPFERKKVRYDNQGLTKDKPFEWGNARKKVLGIFEAHQDQGKTTQKEGEEPIALRLLQETHRRADGTYISDRVQEIEDAIQPKITDRLSQLEESCGSTQLLPAEINSLYLEVVQPDAKGRIYGVGAMATQLGDGHPDATSIGHHISLTKEVELLKKKIQEFEDDRRKIARLKEAEARIAR